MEKNDLAVLGEQNWEEGASAAAMAKRTSTPNYMKHRACTTYLLVDGMHDKSRGDRHGLGLSWPQTKPPRWGLHSAWAWRSCILRHRGNLGVEEMLAPGDPNRILGAEVLAELVQAKLPLAEELQGLDEGLEAKLRIEGLRSRE